MKYVVYIIRNTDTGQCYYGLTKNVKSRELSHFRKLRRNEHSNPHLQYSYNKYGEDSFTFSVYESNLTLEQAQTLEKMLIGIDQDSYNLTTGGELHIPSEEVKNKLSQTRKEVWSDPARREKQSELLKEVWSDPARREEVSQKSKEMWSDPEFRESQKESQKVQSKKMKELWSDPEWREERRRKQKSGWTIENRQKQSERMREYWENKKCKQSQ